jgi:excinuclease ABC subunit A
MTTQPTAQTHILIKGAKMHNLKNIDINIPRNKLVVVTGVSGSGKSSLIFDTLFAEGQRRYVESLSSYARQFLSRMKKPDVEYIKGLAPAMAIEQKVTTNNPRSTVGTSTEIYDYLKLLFARIGSTISPISGCEVRKDTVDGVVDFVQAQPADVGIIIFCPMIAHENRTFADELSVLAQKGYNRVLFNKNLERVAELLERVENKEKVTPSSAVMVMIDRLTKPADATDATENDDFETRLADGIQTAFYEGGGECFVHINGKEHHFSNKFEVDNVVFEEPTVNLFSFNNPYGACKTCEGFGKVMGINPDLVLPDHNLSVFADVVACWRTPEMSAWKKNFLRQVDALDFPIHRPYTDLTDEQKNVLWHGDEFVEGIDHFFQFLESQQLKIQYRVLLSRYRGRTACPDCKGTRLRKDAGYVKIITEGSGTPSKNIMDLVLMPIDSLLIYFNTLQLDLQKQAIAQRLTYEITTRLQYLCNVGLGYLTLNRLSHTLSGGESQRIKLATSLGSSLVGSLYILDEPSIGLHPRDNMLLVGILQKLRNAGNTVIVVEHEENIMLAADQIIDIGPEAGVLGGELIFQGTIDQMKTNQGLTAQYLNNTMQVNMPKTRRKWTKYIEITGARLHNLKNIDVKFPLNVLTAITGVSGSGKTSLIKSLLYPLLQRHIISYGDVPTGKYNTFGGDLKHIKTVELIDQNPIGRSSRSNPVTYIKVYDYIRELYAKQPLAKARGYTAGYFSFNVDGGRCNVCQGDGTQTIEMQFLADVTLPCESCNGKRFKEEILDINYQEKNISQVLDLSVDEAMIFFETEKAIVTRLKPLQDVGLGYVSLGQSSSTLSGGESQRIKLASYLVKGNQATDALFIFDEPTTGLHFHDINKLMYALQALIQQGNTIIVIEHNQDVIKCADWVIDLGAEAGTKGGNVVFEGTPEGLILCQESHTGKFLKEKMG